MTPRPRQQHIVCECLKVTEGEILEAIRTQKISTVRDVIEYTCAGDGCTACHPLLREYLERSRARNGRADADYLDGSPTCSAK